MAGAATPFEQVVEELVSQDFLADTEPLAHASHGVDNAVDRGCDMYIARNYPTMYAAAKAKAIPWPKGMPKAKPKPKPKA